MISLQKTPRLKLVVQKKPYWQQLTPGLSLGYRRTRAQGVWVVRVADGKVTNGTKCLSEEFLNHINHL